MPAVSRAPSPSERGHRHRHSHPDQSAAKTRPRTRFETRVVSWHSQIAEHRRAGKTMTIAPTSGVSVSDP